MAYTIQQQISQTANQWGIPPEIALAVAARESGFNQSARGKAGEVGVFQLMPGTAEGLGVDAYSLSDNITGGVAYLKQMFDRFGNWTDALAAYNAGPGSVDRGAIPASTTNYVQAILAKVGSSIQEGTSVISGGASDLLQGSNFSFDIAGVGVNWWLVGAAGIVTLALWGFVRE